jgi:hypothetical protein
LDGEERNGIARIKRRRRHGFPDLDYFQNCNKALDGLSVLPAQALNELGAAFSAAAAAPAFMTTTLLEAPSIAATAPTSNTSPGCGGGTGGFQNCNKALDGLSVLSAQALN